MNTKLGLVANHQSQTCTLRPLYIRRDSGREAQRLYWDILIFSGPITAARNGFTRDWLRVPKLRTPCYFDILRARRYPGLLNIHTRLHLNTCFPPRIWYLFYLHAAMVSKLTVHGQYCGFDSCYRQCESFTASLRPLRCYEHVPRRPRPHCRHFCDAWAGAAQVASIPGPTSAYYTSSDNCCETGCTDVTLSGWRLGFRTTWGVRLAEDWFHRAGGETHRSKW